MNRFVRGVEVQDVEADELWCFVGCKEKTKHKVGETYSERGDAYTFVAHEPKSKFVLSWHLGGRTAEDASFFVTKKAAGPPVTSN